MGYNGCSSASSIQIRREMLILLAARTVSCRWCRAEPFLGNVLAEVMLHPKGGWHAMNAVSVSIACPNLRPRPTPAPEYLLGSAGASMATASQPKFPPSSTLPLPLHNMGSQKDSCMEVSVSDSVVRVKTDSKTTSRTMQLEVGGEWSSIRERFLFTTDWNFSKLDPWGP